MKPHTFANIQLREMSAHVERDQTLTPQCKTKWRETLVQADEALIKLPQLTTQAAEAQQALTEMAAAGQGNAKRK